MYSLQSYFSKVNSIIIIIVVIVLIIVAYYLVKHTFYKKKKQDKGNISAFLIILEIVALLNFNRTVGYISYLLDYPNAKASKFEVVEGLYEDKKVIKESLLSSIIRQTTMDESGYRQSAPANKIRDKVNGIWLNSSISDSQFGFDGTLVGKDKYRIYYLKYTRIIVKEDKLD